jgi:hypothetical protein
LLIELAELYPAMKMEAARHRSLLSLAEAGHESDLEAALMEEERSEREADKQYWLPLKKELEQLRLRRIR